MAIATESKFHILAVDDSLIDRKLIERLLKISSYQVTTVDSGSKALEFLGWHDDNTHSSPNSPVSPNNHQEVQVNLIITDYCMPGMTGYDLLKKIKESSSLRNIPVVIMSSENVPSRINRCLEEGAEEFFLKPVQLSDLSKLKPYIMKSKVDVKKQEDDEETSEDMEESELFPDQEHHLMEQPRFEESSEDMEESELFPEQEYHQTEQPQFEESSEEMEDSERESQQPQSSSSPELQFEDDEEEASNNNKRKSMEEGPSPDRTRPRYNG